MSKQFNVFNEHGAYLGYVEADNVKTAIHLARERFPLEPIAVQEVKRYGDLVEKNRQLSKGIRDYLNDKLSEFYRDTGVCISEIEVEFQSMMDGVDYVSNVKLHLNL